MAAAASSGPRDIQSDRNNRAKVKMGRKLRQRGHRDAIAHLTTQELVQLIQETLSEEVHYNQRMKGNFRTNRPQWVEVSEDYYNHCLNALPPVTYKALGHIMGSAFGHNGSGESVWFCFLQVCDRHRQTHYLGKICTIEQWRAAYLGATYENLMRITARTCDECNGTGKDGSHSYPEPCPVCNGKGELWPDLRGVVIGSTDQF